MLKSVLFIPCSLFFLSSYSLARDSYFVRYPVLNSQVENFTSAFINNFLPEIGYSQVRFDYTEGTDGTKNTDMAYGQIRGTYQGVATVPGSDAIANIVMDFRINLEVAPQKPNEKTEFAINLRADGNIDNSGNFMNFFMGILSPECIEDDHIKDKTVIGDICRAFVEKKIDANKSNVDNAYEILTLWKTKFVEGLNKIEHPEIKPIKTEFIKYISDRIQLSKTAAGIILSINLENVGKDYGTVAKNFLKDSKMIDYTLKSLEVQMNESEIQFSTHVVKLHVISSFNKYMEMAAGLTSIYENPENGVNLGKAFREGQVSRGDIFSKASTSDKASAILTGGMIKIWGSQNAEPVIATQEEADLGLD